MQHERRVELAAVGLTAGLLEITGEIERKDVHSEHARPPCEQGRQGFLVRIVAVRGKNNEGIDAALLPGAEQVVHPAMQSLTAHGGIARISSLRRGIHAVGDGRSAQDAEAGGEIISEPLND